MFFVLLSATEVEPLGMMVYRTPAAKTLPCSSMIATGLLLMLVEIKYPQAYIKQPKA